MIYSMGEIGEGEEKKGGVMDWLKGAAKDVAEAGKEALKSKIKGIPQREQTVGGVPIIIGPQPPAPTPAFSPAMKYGLLGVGGLLVVGVIIAATRR